MNRTSVSSSNIASIGYDPTSCTLEVEFHNGLIYQYFDVPKPVFDALMSAASHGQYFNSHIKERYRFAKV